MGSKKSRKALSAGRPPLSQQPRSTISARATRTIIRRHHNLLKAQTAASKSGDDAGATAIAAQINENGGLEKYQRASQIGQLNTRGGDTSKILCEWLKQDGILDKNSALMTRLNILEIGCLSTNNAISRFKNVHIIRTDLHSTHASILEEDFMQRPLPTDENEYFDLISLSLVLNYVPDPAGRGDMLLRTTQFLIHRASSPNGAVLPALFLTLPLPCVMNSRYLSVEYLDQIMQALGYTLLHSKTSTKIYYSLWRLGQAPTAKAIFPKVEVAPGKARNNFCIVMK